MELSPGLYHWIVRPKWFFNACIGNMISSNFDLDNKKVLDFGCGVGSSCFMLNPVDYLGVDCDRKRIQYAKRLHPSYHFDIVQDNQIPVGDHSMDYVLMISVLHHIPTEHFTKYLKELHRILKANGRIIIIEPCYFEKSYINNRFMDIADKGNYIRNEQEYLGIFDNWFETSIIKKYNQLLFYNKIFFMAVPKQI